MKLADLEGVLSIVSCFACQSCNFFSPASVGDDFSLLPLQIVPQFCKNYVRAIFIFHKCQIAMAVILNWIDFKVTQL